MLCEAVLAEDPEVLQLLLDSGWDTKAYTTGHHPRTALHEACFHGELFTDHTCTQGRIGPRRRTYSHLCLPCGADQAASMRHSASSRRVPTGTSPPARACRHSRWRPQATPRSWWKSSCTQSRSVCVRMQWARLPLSFSLKPLG